LHSVARNLELQTAKPFYQRYKHNDLNITNVGTFFEATATGYFAGDRGAEVR